MANIDQLRKHLNGLSSRGSRYLRRYALKETIEAAMSHVHFVALVVPVLFAGSMIGQRIFDTVWWTLSPILTILLAIVLPVAYVLLAGALGFLLGKVGRTYSLALFDRELGYKDRLQTADEFLKLDDLSPFQRASVDDAIPFAEKATNTKLKDIKIATPSIHSTKWGYGIAAAVLIVVGIMTNIGGFASQSPTVDAPEEFVAMVEPEDPPLPEVVEIDQETRSIVAPPEQQRGEDSIQESVLESSEVATQDSALRRANPSDSSPQQSSQMGMSGGASQDNKAGSAASNLSGQGNPEKKKETEPGPTKEGESKKSNSPLDKEQQKDESATGIAGGKGSGTGRQSSSAEMMENDNKTKQDDMDSDVDLESDDEEDEQQEAANAGRPLLNQRKAPVDRNLSPSGMIGQDEDERANGRGGPGGLKKTRGVAAMLLGVPMPDQLRSQINPGRIKIQRERAVPHPSEVDAVASENRGEMDESVGKVPRQTLRPWMRNVVSKYFATLRQEPVEQGE